MADSVRDYFVDLFSDPPRFVRGLKDESEQPFLIPYHNNNLVISWRALRRNVNGGLTTPYTLVDLTGASLTVKVWNTAGAIVLANQASWTLDATGTILFGNLNLFTAEMVTAIASVAFTGYLTTLFEATFTLGDGGIYTYRNNAWLVGKALNVAGSPVSNPSESFFNTTASDARYVRRDGGVNGDFFILKSASGKQLQVYAADLVDGGVELRAEQIT